MRLLAALCLGVFVACAVGFLTGHPPTIRIRVRTTRAEVSARQLWLQQAGLAVTPRQFWSGSAAVGVVAFAIVVAITRTPVVALVPAVGVALLPRAYFSRKRAARMRVVQDAWPDGLRDLLASISAGRSMPQALSSLTSTGPTPLREAFARFPMLARMLGTVPALEIVKEELADPTSDRIIEVLILAHERGGHIVRQILEDLAAATTKDLKSQAEIISEGLEMKINARAVLVLPWMVLLLLTMTSPPFRDFYGSPAGVLVVILGGLMSLFGTWLLARLSRDEGEQRVFGSAALRGVDQ